MTEINPDPIDAEIEGLQQQVEQWKEEAHAKRRVAESAGSRVAALANQLADLEGELATAQKELRRSEGRLAELTEQLEEAQVSPLDLAQQQRAKALTLSRDVVAETGSAGVFTKSASAKVSLAGVLSTAHFIVSGERDYVTGEGEYVLDDTRRALPAREIRDHFANPTLDPPVGPGGHAYAEEQADD